MKRTIKTSLICFLIFGALQNVYPCTRPAAPINTTPQKTLSICEGQKTKLVVKGLGKIGWYSAASGGIYLGSDSQFITQNLVASTTFYAQDSTCGASLSRTAINVIVNPQAKANFYVNDICESDSASFINLSKNAKSYSWKFGDANTSNKTNPKHLYDLKGTVCWPNNVTLVATGANGCSDSISKPIVINAHPVSDFTFTVNLFDVKFVPKQMGNTEYKWIFGKKDSSLLSQITYSYTQLGKDSVCLKTMNAAGCYSKTCKEVWIKADVRFAQILPSFQVYPNPNFGKFTLKKNQNHGLATLEVINSIGQIVHRQEIDDALTPMDLNLKSGVYLLKLSDGQSHQIQKMAIRRE